MAPYRQITFVLTACMLIGACGGGSGSGSSLSLGGNQEPDPVVEDFAIAYVKRPLLLDEDGNLLAFDVREPTVFNPGAVLYLRDRASPSAPETVLTDGVFPPDEDGEAPLYDVKDLAVSYDGTKLAFAMRAPEIPGADEDDQPTWNIWIYDLEADMLRRVIESDITAEAGHDIAPRFLPGGRLIFASTRQRQSKAILLDEGKPQFAALDEDRNDAALTLHVMDEDGTDIHQVSFNQSHDLDPAVLSDGRVVYSRWDNVAGRDAISLYAMNPDGTEQRILYGFHSHDTGPGGATIEFMEPQPLPGGRVLVMMRSSQAEVHMGASPVAIDTGAYTDHDQPTPDYAGVLADAQDALVDGEIFVAGQPSPRGRFASVFPLFDGTDRLLVTWSQCRVLDPASDPLDPEIVPCTDELLADPAIEEADPLYGIWMLDPATDTQQPIVTPEEGFAYTEAVVLEGRAMPPVILDKVAGIDLDSDLVSESVGTVHVRSVYDLDGTDISGVGIDVLRDPTLVTPDQRPARFVRIVKAVSIPDDDLVELDGTAFGRSQAQLMREIIGYAPIEPDGSFKLEVPANVAFTIAVLDANGRRIGPRHQNWLTLRPGEEMECNGCHSPESQLSHGRPDAAAPSINDGAPADGSPFPGTNPALFADAGETMAEVATRINGVPPPSVDIVFDDVWTDPAATPASSFAYRYSNLTTPAPVAPACVTNWNASCRITIHYETHIHPIWGVDRRVLDTDGVTVLADHTCNTCHSTTDAIGAVQVPVAQLDLADGPSQDEPDHFASYRELLFPDNEQEIVAGAAVDRLVQATDEQGNPLFETDADGNLILDANGDPIPILVAIELEAPMTPAGANASERFFSLFAPGASHAGWLSDAELKLISEWLDIGAQYYNDPFAVPQ